MVYDAEGNLTSTTDPLGQVTTTSYDARNRPTLVSYSPPAIPTGDDLTSIATVYDGNDHPTQITETYSASGDRVTTQAWDQLENLTRVETPEGVVTSTWDPAGNRTRMTDPSGRTTHYTYDARNRLSSVTLSGLGVTEYEYLRDGRVSSIDRPNGVTTTYSYDGAGRVEKIAHAGAATVARTAYTYDANGNRSTEESENGAAPQTTTYAYDAADRLTSVTYPDETVTYTLDPVGNRTRELTTVSGAPTSDKTLAYDDRDRLTSVTDSIDPANDATYSYDANGNLTATDEGGVQRSLVYDQRDRLVRVTEDSTPVLTARYDWRGQRVLKDGAVGMRKYLWDGDNLLSEHDESGATLTTHYHPDSRPGATPLASFNTAAGWSFLHEDGLGSVVATTALSASVSERSHYDAWGATTSQSGFAAHQFGFTGHIRDQETGTLYVRARDYDPGTGRFLTEDPVAGGVADPPTQHPYLYARANPTTYVDPSGKVGIFFDGTWKDRSDDERLSNIVRLFNLYFERLEEIRGRELAAQLAIYREGVQAGVTGLGGKARVQEAYQRIVDIYNAPWATAEDKQIDLFGFSRGAALARDLANLIRKEGIPDFSRQIDTEPVYERQDDGTVKRVESPVYARFEDVSIRFLGLFDTVAAFGWPTNGVDPLYDLSVDPEFVRNVRHAVATHEVRYAFDSHSVVRDPEAPWADPNIIERFFFGGHSDVGGGLKPGAQGKPNDLAKVALAWMHAEARLLELPFADLPGQLVPPKGLLNRSEAELEGGFIHGPPPWYVLEKWLKRQARTVYYHTPAGRVKRRITLQEAIARAEADRVQIVRILESANEHLAIEPRTTQ